MIDILDLAEPCAEWVTTHRGTAAVTFTLLAASIAFIPSFDHEANPAPQLTQHSISVAEFNPE